MNTYNQLELDILDKFEFVPFDYTHSGKVLYKIFQKSGYMVMGVHTKEEFLKHYIEIEQNKYENYLDKSI